MNSDFPELFKEAFELAAKKIFSAEKNKPNGSYENPYILCISWNIFNEIKDKLDHNMLYHSELTGNWHKVYVISTDK